MKIKGHEDRGLLTVDGECEYGAGVRSVPCIDYQQMADAVKDGEEDSTVSPSN